MRHPYTSILLAARGYAAREHQPNEARGLSQFDLAIRRKISTVCAVLEAGSKSKEVSETERAGFAAMLARVEPWKAAWTRAFGYTWDDCKTLPYGSYGQNDAYTRALKCVWVWRKGDPNPYDHTPGFLAAVAKIKEMEAVAKLEREHTHIDVAIRQRGLIRSR